MTSVSGIDSTASMNFMNLKKYCEDEKVEIIYCGMSEQVKKTFMRLKIIAKQTKIFQDRDYGLEYCEDKLLERYKSVSTSSETVLPSPRRRQISLFDVNDLFLQESEGLVSLLLEYCQLKHATHRRDYAMIAYNYFEKVELPEKTVIYKSLEKSECLYFIEKRQSYCISGNIK